jgi:hypothetical protein
MLYGPARGTYWLQDGEVHLLYELRGKPAVHYAGPIPPKQMAPVLVYLLLMWPLIAMVVALAVALGLHLTSRLSAYGVAIATPSVVAVVVLLVVQVLRRRRRRKDSVAVVPARPTEAAGRLVAPDVPLPEAVLAATWPRSRADWYGG